MIVPSNGFREELASGNRNYLISASLYTTDGTYLITNAQVWEHTFAIEDMISQDETFTVGTAIINKLTFALNNITEQYSGVNFKNAVIIPQVGLVVSGQPEMLQKGIFIVEDSRYDGAIIRLTCLDLMEVFDRQYNTDLSYPATLRQIVNDAVSKCGITINGSVFPTVPDTFPNETFTVSEKPTKDSLSYREVLSWCAQIAGCYARVSRLGKLEFKWFDTTTLETIQEVIDSSTVQDYAGVHKLSDCFSTDVGIHETEVTGVNVTYQVKQKDGSTKVHTASVGDINTFKVEVTDNDFIASDEQANTVAETVADHVVGMKFFRSDATHLSDPCIEAGDLSIVRNFRGNYYPALVSRTRFGISTSQTTNSNAETDSKNTSYRDMPSININTDFPTIEIPTDLLVITDPNGDDWAIFVDPTGTISTVKVPKRIYYNQNPVTEYFPGDTVDVSTAVVHAVYNDGTEIDVTSECTFEPAQGDAVPEGDFTITATWVFTPGVTNNGGN